MRRPAAAFELEALLRRFGECSIATLPSSRVHHFAIATELEIDAGGTVVAQVRVDLLVELSQTPESLALRG